MNQSKGLFSQKNNINCVQGGSYQQVNNCNVKRFLLSNLFFFCLFVGRSFVR